MLPLERLMEETPVRPTGEMTTLAHELGCAPPEYCPVMAKAGARPDTCVLNVQAANRQWGGELRFGWLLTECPGLWITARFRAVRRTSTGLFVDETPGQNGVGRGWSLFAHRPDLGAAFDFRRHDPTRRLRVYVPRPRSEGALPSVGCGDPVADAIDGYLATLAGVDSLYEPTSTGLRCVDPNQIAPRFEVVTRAQRRLLRLLEPGNGGPG